MEIVQAILLGIVQGLTEFLPVSSSGHLLLMHHFFGISQHDLMFDVSLHIGTLLALLIVFSKDIWQLAFSLVVKSNNTRIAWLLALATMPGVMAGILLQDFAESSFRSPYLVSITLIIVAFAMLAAERISRNREYENDVHTMARWQALLIGLAQAIALIPGVSRSGSTITTGLFAGLTRVAATRFSFLLSVPITFGAIIKVLTDSSFSVALDGQAEIFIAGIIAAFLSGMVAIRILMGFVAKHSLDIFAYYRILLGTAALVILSVS